MRCGQRSSSSARPPWKASGRPSGNASAGREPSAPSSRRSRSSCTRRASGSRSSPPTSRRRRSGSPPRGRSGSTSSRRPTRWSCACGRSCARRRAKPGLPSWSWLPPVQRRPAWRSPSHSPRCAAPPRPPRSLRVCSTDLTSRWRRSAPHASASTSPRLPPDPPPTCRRRRGRQSGSRRKQATRVCQGVGRKSRRSRWYRCPYRRMPAAAAR
mmetsp:Transcript_40616/g.117446  ORF Transcript_40616/g.117446 Transcript_40616/m.117446 type:complete len:212 (-) Transcript_40616:599-1234(-)